jgi:hypothetical protein
MWEYYWNGPDRGKRGTVNPYQRAGWKGFRGSQQGMLGKPTLRKQISYIFYISFICVFRLILTINIHYFPKKY